MNKKENSNRLYTLRVDPYNYTFKQVGIELIGIELIGKTLADIMRSFNSDEYGPYGFTETSGRIVAIWHVRWKVYHDNHTLKITE